MQLDGGTSSWKELRIAVVCGDVRSVQANLYERVGASSLLFAFCACSDPNCLWNLTAEASISQSTAGMYAQRYECAPAKWILVFVHVGLYVVASGSSCSHG